MRRRDIIATLGYLVLLASRLAALRFPVAGIRSHSAVLGFLRQLQAAVQRDDHHAVAVLMAYPLRANDGGGGIAIHNTSEFTAQYDDIITPTVRHAILVQAPESLFTNWRGVMIGNGQVWFSLICAAKSTHSCTRVAVIAINRHAPHVP